jgi:hypothetical protein
MQPDAQDPGSKEKEYLIHLENMEGGANVSRLIKLPKLSERGCEYSADGRWKVVERVFCLGVIVHCMCSAQHKLRSNIVFTKPSIPPDGKQKYENV